MKKELDKYNIELIDESDYSSDSGDNLLQYQHEYVNEQNYKPTTQIGIKLYDGNRILSSAIIKSTGGASGIYKTSQILNNESLSTCCSESVFKFSIPELTMEWLTKADDVTCFQIFNYKEDFMIHGEISITRIAYNGQILWQNCGAHIFTTEKGENDFELNNGIIQIKDWNNKLYKFNIEGNSIN